MTPKEKAEESVKKYSIILYDEDLPRVDIFRAEINELKRISLIAVDEVINSLKITTGYLDLRLNERQEVQMDFDYWENVKQEIEKL